MLLPVFFGTTLVVSRLSGGQYAPLTYVGLPMLISSIHHVIIHAFSKERRLPRNRRAAGFDLGSVNSRAVWQCCFVSSQQKPCLPTVNRPGKGV